MAQGEHPPVEVPPGLDDRLHEPSDGRGRVDLRELLDPAVIASVVARLQRTAPERAARDADDPIRYGYLTTAAASPSTSVS